MRVSAMTLAMVLLVWAPYRGQEADPASGRTGWPQWRGPLATGVAPNATPPTEWSELSNVRWKVEVPGHGSASPIVWGNHVFVLTSTAVTGPEVPIQPIENYRARSLGGTMTRG